MAGGPSPFVNAFSAPAISSLRYNTAQYGSPIFRVYGTQRVSVNLIEEFGYNGGQSGKGGKGGGGSSSGGKKGNANYSAYVAWAICEGPVSFTDAYGAGGSGGNTVWSNGGISNISRVGLNVHAGNDGQPADAAFISFPDPNGPGPPLGYSGTAIVTGTPIELGSSPALPNISFQISGFGFGTVGQSGGIGQNDANPAFIVEDMLTSPRGGAGFPAGNLDIAGSLEDYENYCQAAYLGLSLLMDRLQPAARWLEEICELTVSAPVWSGAILKIIPYGDQELDANGATWTPNLTWQYSLTDSDFLDMGGGSDPVILTRKDPANMTNWLGLEYLDTNNSYNPQIMPEWDQGLIDQYGIRNEPPVQAHSITNPQTAQISARLQLQRKAYIRNTYKFKLGFRYSLLEPMDIVLITDATLGLAGAPVRITGIDEDDNGELTVTAEEIPGDTP